MTDRILGFSRETFIRRRARVLEGIEEGILILPSSPLLHRSGGTEYRYRPDSELFYLTGCTEPQVVAVLRGGEEGDPFLLFVPRRNPEAELWSGPRMGPEEAREHFGADAAYPMDEMESRLPGLLKNPRRVFFRFGFSPPSRGWWWSPSRPPEAEVRERGSVPGLWKTRGGSWMV